MHNGRFRLSVWISFTQPDDPFVRVDSDPDVGYGSNVNRDTARNVDGFNRCNFHGRIKTRDPKLSPSISAIVNIIVDNISHWDVDCPVSMLGLRIITFK